MHGNHGNSDTFAANSSGLTDNSRALASNSGKFADNSRDLPDNSEAFTQQLGPAFRQLAKQKSGRSQTKPAAP